MDLANNEFWRKKLMTDFRVRDTNKNGFTSRSDFESIVQRYKDLGVPDQRLKKLNDCYDVICEKLGLADPSTKLTYEEAVANLLKHADIFNDVEKVLEAHYEVIDSNENGVISFKEWENIYKAINNDTSHARGSFDVVDTNGDGIVSKEEFLAYCKEFYLTAEDKLKSSIMFGPLD